MISQSRLTRWAVTAMAVLVLGACARSVTPTPTAVSTIDTDRIVATVVAEVQAEQEASSATDSATLEDMVQAAVAEQLANLESSQVAALVEEAVAAELAAQQITPINLDDPATVATTDLEATLEQVYQQANPSVVYVIVPNIGSGSGFVYDESGHIVTNNHVVSGGRSFEVVFANGVRLAASLVGSDADSDLAVLKVASLPDGVNPLPLAQTDDLRVGQFVIAIGNPFGEQGSMSLGIVSGLDRDLRSQRTQNARTGYALPSVIQTDAPINPGNSGGPLLNLAGEVVGINSAIASTTGVNSGVGFAIPVIAVQRIVPDLIAAGEHTYSYLGASFDDEISLGDQSQLGLVQTRGAYLVSVTVGGPADRAGLIAANAQTGRGGDLVVKVDGQDVADFGDLNRYLVFETRPGQTIELTVLRNGQEVVVPLTLGERP